MIRKDFITLLLWIILFAALHQISEKQNAIAGELEGWRPVIEAHNAQVKKIFDNCNLPSNQRKKNYGRTN